MMYVVTPVYTTASADIHTKELPYVILFEFDRVVSSGGMYSRFSLCLFVALRPSQQI